MAKQRSSKRQRLDSVGAALVNALQQDGHAKLANLWRAFLGAPTTIYVRSEEGHRPLDGYALHWIGRYFPATLPGLRVVPILDRVEDVPADHLILLGRLHAFQSETLLEQIGAEIIHARGRFRAIDGERLLQLDSGELWTRVEQQRWARDYGVIRLWRQASPPRLVLNFSGLGSIGTLGSVLALCDVRRAVRAEIEAGLPGRLTAGSFTEILICAERIPAEDPLVVSPEEVIIRTERIHHGEGQLNLPRMIFSMDAGQTEGRYEVVVCDPDGGRPLQLSTSQVEYAVLAAIARHTAKEPSVYADRGGYISYDRIAGSEVVRAVLRDPDGLHVPVVRATVARLRKRLLEPDWQRRFPNLILRSKLRPPGSRKERVVLRLRAHFQFLGEEIAFSEFGGGA